MASEHAGNNGDGAKLVVKAELINKQLSITFGQDVHPLMYDRAIRLINLQMDNMIIKANMPQPDMSKIVKLNTPITGNISDILKGKRL